MSGLNKSILVALALRVSLVLALAAPVQAQQPAAAAAAAPVEDDAAVQALLQRLEPVVQSGDLLGYLDLVAGAANRGRATDFGRSEILSGATRAVIRERDRVPFGSSLRPGGYRVIVDVFVEFGKRARVATWQLDIQRTDGPWQIIDQERLTSVENLYRVALDTSKQYAATNLTITAEDLVVTLESGSVFVAPTEAGVTGLVLLGRGEMRFRPRLDTERVQVKIFCGSETLVARFDAAFLRIDPSDAGRVVASDALVPRPVEPRDLRKANEVFAEDSSKSFQLGLGDLSSDAWSLLPGSGNFVGEIHTRRFGTLTYTRSKSDPEDITLFDRLRRRNIAVYASEETLARRGPSYSDDDSREYDVIDYNIDLAVSPGRLWLDGLASMVVRVRAPTLSTVSLRLADSLVVRSITSDRFGRLFGFRVNRQNVVVINLPATLTHDTLLKLTLVYAGRLEPQSPDGSEAVAAAAPLAAGQDQIEQPEFTAEPSFLYSNRSAWYPQATTTDYATATLKISVPVTYDCVASGVLQAGWPRVVGSKEAQSERKVYTFSADQPLRYLAFIVSKFVRAETRTVTFAPFERFETGAPKVGLELNSVTLSVEANARQVKRGQNLAEHAADILQFYASLTGDVPYPTFTLVLVEGELPGGHSPAYFAQLFQPLPMMTLSWRNDPAAFDRFPDFFLAHELAHQWWGQAVGWRNYHEQWISEGFAQYFSALYAQRQRGDNVFAGIMRQMRRWAMSESDQGAVSLGYRLGHIKGDGRIFRALVYNKSASVLHMLRHLVGDDAFFAGLRRFYATSRFQKVGTDEFKQAVEIASGRPLDRFFDQWIHGSTLPRLKVNYHVEGSELAVHIEQLGEVFDVPVTLTLEYADKKKTDVVIAVTEQAVDRRLPLAGPLQDVEINRDDGTLAEFVK
jgi:hypothetical protein